MSGVPGEYRAHADDIERGEKARPAKALLIEVDANGVLNVEAFGIAKNHREIVAFLAQGVRALGDAIHTHNACASH